MMDFSPIISAKDSKISKIYTAYTTTFPEEERRDDTKFLALFNQPKAKIMSITENSENIGYLIIWELTNNIFVEHFEVFEEFRNKKYGSKILEHLSKVYPKIVLEIEPPHLSEEATRRYRFYQKNNYNVIDKNYIQPSYGPGKKSLELWLLANYAEENPHEIAEEIHRIVYDL